MYAILFWLIVFCILYALFYHKLPKLTDSIVQLRDIWCYDINRTTLENDNYRKVVNTTSNMQLVLMKLKPGEEIGMERHSSATQFIHINQGDGEAIVKGEKFQLNTNTGLVIPPNTLHNIINTGTSEMKLYTVYSPPEHRPSLVQTTKEI